MHTAKLQAWHTCNFTGLQKSTQFDQDTVKRDPLLIHDVSSFEGAFSLILGLGLGLGLGKFILIESVTLMVA